MRKQRLIIFTVVSTVLLMAIIGIFVLLDNQQKQQNVITIVMRGKIT